MKLTIKTLKNSAFSLEVPETATVGDVKKQLETQQGEEYYAAGLKLIHAGRILSDDLVIEQCNIKETDFIVAMPGKPRAAAARPAPAPAAAPAAAAPAPAAAPAAASAPAPTPSAPASASAPAPAGGEGPTLNPSETTITQLVEMGFPRDQVILALRAAFGNSDRAVEYLYSGIPPGLVAPAAPSAPSAPASAPAPSAGGAPASAPVSAPVAAPAPAPAAGGAPAGGFALSPASPLQALASNPLFLQLRATVQRSPQMLPALLQGLGQRSPAVIQLINDNQEDFYQLLNMTDGQSPQGPPQGFIQVHLTPAEMEAVDRLVAMGFDRNRALQAYLLCDKNEMMAASFMLENRDQD